MCSATKPHSLSGSQRHAQERGTWYSHSTGPVPLDPQLETCYADYEYKF